MDQIQHFRSPERAISLITGQYQAFEFKRHYHLDYHFGLIVKGEQKFACRGERFHVGHGEVVIMSPDVLHDGRSVAESGYQSNVFAIEPEWFASFFDETNLSTELAFDHVVLNDPKLFQLLTHAHAQLRNPTLSQLAQDCLPFDSFYPLITQHGKVAFPEPKKLGNVTLATLKDFLIANLSEPIHLQELADLCGLSPTQFQRHFKASIGMTPYAWLMQLRLEQGMKLLKANHLSTHVAHMVGFYDQAHFSKSFKQAFGISPSDIC